MNGLLARESLSLSQREEMFALLAACFEGVTREQFERDLQEKNWVLEIRRGGRLLGFSTLLVREARHEGRAITVVYSGDTIVVPEAWNSPTLARSWIAAVNRLKAPFPSRPCYWLLLTSGFRTYRILPVFWREFFPRHDVMIPSDLERLLSDLARAQYGPCYDAMAGIVRFPQPQRLRGSLGTIPPGRVSNQHVAYFLSRNPGHGHGDELVCLTEISDGNLTRAGRRMVGS
jgi:hypothetical protein